MYVSVSGKAKVKGIGNRYFDPKSPCQLCNVCNMLKVQEHKDMHMKQEKCCSGFIDCGTIRFQFGLSF